MTFLYNKNIYQIKKSINKKNKNSGSLPTIWSDHKAVLSHITSAINSNSYTERPYLCTSLNNQYHLKGSLTIEAAIGFPIFIIAIFAIISIISVMYLQLSMQIALEETVRNASKTAYISSLYLSLDNNDKKAIDNNSPSMAETFSTSLISSVYLKNAFINKDNEKMLNSPLIKNGANGISFLSSSIDLNQGIADVVITYQVNLPFIPESFFHFNLTNRCYVHLYTGKEISKKQNAVDNYVYYTSYGNVFHFNKYCQYLLNYTEAVRYIDCQYHLDYCALCVNETADTLRKENPIVYITKSNYCYHLSLNCQSFTGNVFRIKYSSLKESDKICETCLEGK